MWKAILAYLAAIGAGIYSHAGDDIKTDQYGMNQTDRDYIAYLKKAVKKGEMTEEEAKAKVISKGGTEEMWNAVSIGSDNLAGVTGTTGGVSTDILQSLIAYFTRNQLTGAEMMQNEFNAGEAQKSRDFTEFMARNKYSMETESMQAAGVNPAMVYGGGNLVPTAANGATGSGSVLSGGNVGDLISTLIRLPREMKMMDAEMEKMRKEGDAAVMNAEAAKANAESNARNATSQERQAAVAEYKAILEEKYTESNIEVNRQTINRMAADIAYTNELKEYVSKNWEVAAKNADSAQKQAIAAMRQADAAVQNAATNDYLSTYQSDYLYAQRLGQDVANGKSEIEMKYLPDYLEAQITEFRNRGFYFDAAGKLQNAQRHLVTAETIREYEKMALDIAKVVASVAVPEASPVLLPSVGAETGGLPTKGMVSDLPTWLGSGK